MVQSPQFKQEFASAVGAKQASLDSRELPQLRDRFDSYRSLYESIYNVLRQKGQLHDDPYKDADQITELTVPPRDRYPDSARRVEMSNRFSAFHSQLEYMSVYYTFSTEFLDLSRTARLGELVHFVDWPHLGPGAKDFMTAELGSAIEPVRNGSDHLSAGIVSDAGRELAALTSQIVSDLRTLASFQRQHYKLMLRTTVLDQVLAEVDEQQPSDSDRLVRQLKRRLAQTGSGRAFYPELAHEVIGEEIGSKVDAARREALSSLNVTLERKGAIDTSGARLASLESAVGSVVGVVTNLRSALTKLQRNDAVIKTRKRGLGERLREWLAKAVKRAPEPTVYLVDFKDPSTGALRSERIDFAELMAAMRRRVRVLAAAAEEGSATHAKLKQADEASRSDFLQHNLNDLRLLHRRASALGAHFTATADPGQKASLQGIKIEMSAVKNGMSKASQSQSEYLAAKQEQEQMARLAQRPPAAL